jgi:type IX secretion system PorP/SprF family membrane protein
MKGLHKYDYFSRAKQESFNLSMQLNIRILTILLFIFGTIVVVNGQQVPTFTHHTYTNMLINPGFAGLGEGICLNGIVRQQWVGFEDPEGNNVAPETFLITGDAPIKILHGGLGASIVQDKIGFFTDIGVNLGYSYHIDVGGANMGIGGSIDLLNRALDYSKFITSGASEGAGGLSKDTKSDMLFDANLGLFWQIPDNYYFGISVTNLLESKGKKLADKSNERFIGDRSFYFVTGYQFRLAGIPAYEFIPALQIITNTSATVFNISGTVSYNNRFWGGVNYRITESVGLMIGMLIKDFRLGYSYDINTLGYAKPGSHEICLGYCFKINTDKGIRTYRNIRYL